MSKLKEMFSRTDWELFNLQKQALIRSIYILSHLNYSVEAENLEGMLNWVDYVQDIISEDLDNGDVEILFSARSREGI